jgi:hypothetical protein
MNIDLRMLMKGNASSENASKVMGFMKSLADLGMYHLIQ